MTRLIRKFILLGGLVAISAASGRGQVINPTPFFTSFADTDYASTFDGQPLPVGSIIQAYDPTGVYCGIDTVDTEGTFGFMIVYGDDPGSPGIDEGAEADDTITFKINGITATVDSGDATWTHGEIKSVSLSAAPTMIAMTGINLPGPKAVAPADTVTFQVDVRNDGDGLDFYGVKLSMSLPGGSGINEWEALEPDSVVYANPDDTVSVFFSIKAPLFNADTANTVTYTVFSNLDTTVTVGGDVDVFMTITDVDDPQVVLPGSFVLQQNYPNPFNPGTIIAFNLSARTTARLDIIDILGRVVESRNLGDLPAGPHQVEYEADGLASGVYFYRLVTESAAQSRKMILLR